MTMTLPSSPALPRQDSSDLYEAPLPIPFPAVNFKAPFIIGVAGGSASGKKEVCQLIIEKLKQKHKYLTRKVAVISLTSFYRVFTPEELRLAQEGEFNFDHPDAFDWKLLEQVIQNLLSGKPAVIPKFDYKRKIRLPEASQVIDFFPDVVLIEGILVLYKKRVRDALSMRLFVDVDADQRLSNTVLRDSQGERERQIKSLELILNQWVKFVKPAFEDFILPSKKTADVIIPRGSTNDVALSLIVQHIDEILLSGNPNRRLSVGNAASPTSINTRPVPENGSPRKASLPSPKLAPDASALDLEDKESLYKPVPN